MNPETSLPLRRIVSGGQAGADRAALDWALGNGFPHGGWCPRGRITEDGPLPAHYLLRETPSAKYSERTRWNVRDSDATVVFTMTLPGLMGGTRLTAEFADQSGKPVLHLWPENARDGRHHPGPVAALQRFLRTHAVEVLNVAGPRASQQPEIYRFVRDVLDAALTPALLTGLPAGRQTPPPAPAPPRKAEKARSVRPTTPPPRSPR